MKMKAMTDNHAILCGILTAALVIAASNAVAQGKPSGAPSLIGLGGAGACEADYRLTFVSPPPRQGCSDMTVFICSKNPEAEICNEPYLSPERAAQVRKDVEFFREALNTTVKGSRKP